MGLFWTLLEEAARATPAAAALEGPGLGEPVPYRELMTMARFARNELSGAGIEEGDCVAVSGGVSPQTFAVLAALSHIGAASVPVPAPEMATSSYGGVPVRWEWSQEAGLRPRADSDGEMLPVPPGTAYVLATSGSSAEPKSVPITEANLTALASALCADRLPAVPGARIALNYGPTFDPFFYVWMQAMLTAGTLVLVPEDRRLLLGGICERFGVTHWDSVPSQIEMAMRLHQVLPGQIDSVHECVLGGEPLRGVQVSGWRHLAARGSRMRNTYGPTELTISCFDHVLDEEDYRKADAEPQGVTPIGMALPGIEWKLADLAFGGTGRELLVRGPQRFPGYLDSRHSMDRFVDDAGAPVQPIGNVMSESAWFKTGDLVTESPRGLCFVGRTDSQVKVRGRRVDLEQVRSELLSASGAPDGWVGILDGAIVAVLETGPPSQPVSLAALRAYARPKRAFLIDRLPRHPDGKLDAVSLRAACVSGELEDLHLDLDAG